jgi:hypothetical protein
MKLVKRLLKWTTRGLLVVFLLVSPVIERTSKLSEAPEALRILDQGHARGKTVISIE